MFEVNSYYSREDIYRLLSVPFDQQKGQWHSGYRIYNGIYFLFIGLGEEAKYKNNYDNYWINVNTLHWNSKKNRTLNSEDVRKLASHKYPVLIFTRMDDRSLSFKFEGLGKAKRVRYNRTRNLVEFEWGIIRKNFATKSRTKYSKLISEPVLHEEWSDVHKNTEQHFRTVGMEIVEVIKSKFFRRH